MNTAVKDILQKMDSLEKQLEQEFETRRERFQYHLDKRRVKFAQEALAQHRAFKQNLLAFWRHSGVMNLIAAPVIYALVIPLVILDLSLSVYQFICFPIYGIRKVPRSDFIVIDRHHLEYLNAVEKLNCAYCGYANGVIAFGRELASRTEERWCPIKHARRVRGVHPRYFQFDDFGDAQSFRKREQHSGE